MRNRSRRRMEIARSAISFAPIPRANAAPRSAPMLVPAYRVGLMPSSIIAWSTPMCANPFIPPPPRTSEMRRARGPDVRREGVTRLLEVLIQAVQADDGAADHDDLAAVTADERAGNEAHRADVHQGF